VRGEAGGEEEAGEVMQRENTLVAVVIVVVVILYFVTGWPLWVMPVISFVLALLGNVATRAYRR
jgi:hypothetical protein